MVRAQLLGRKRFSNGADLWHESEMAKRKKNGAAVALLGKPVGASGGDR